MPQLSEIAGGAGFTFEDAVFASQLAKLLAEEAAFGLNSRFLKRIALQQASFGEPLAPRVATTGDLVKPCEGHAPGPFAQWFLLDPREGWLNGEISGEPTVNGRIGGVVSDANAIAC